MLVTLANAGPSRCAKHRDSYREAGMTTTVEPLSAGQAISPEDLNSVMADRRSGERLGPAY